MQTPSGQKIVLLSKAAQQKQPEGATSQADVVVAGAEGGQEGQLAAVAISGENAPTGSGPGLPTNIMDEPQTVISSDEHQEILQQQQGTGIEQSKI